MSRYNEKKSSSGKRQSAHRTIWEETHNCKIPPGYEVHHIDGNGHNNDPSNLMLLTISEHKLLHAKLRKEGKEIVDSSDPDVIKARQNATNWAKAHPEVYAKYRHEHREEHRAANKRWYQANKAELAAKKRQWCLANPDKIKAAAERTREVRKAQDRLRRAIRKKYPQAEIEKRTYMLQAAIEVMNGTE